MSDVTEKEKPAKAPINRDYISLGPRDRQFETVTRRVLPSQVEAILETAIAGDIHAQAQLFGIMQDTWPRLTKNLNEIKKAVARLPWTVNPYTEDGEEATPQAEERKKVVESVIWGCRPSAPRFERNFTGAVYDLLDAFGAGISVLEMYFGKDGRPFTPKAGILGVRAFRQIPSQFYAFPNVPGVDDRLMLNPNGTGNAFSGLVDFPEDKFIVGICPARSGHPANTALLRSLSKYWIAAQFGFSWLTRYAEIFGQPIRWATYDPQNTGVLNDITAMLENLGSAGWGAFPIGTTLELKEPTGRAADNPQAYLQEIADKAADILILGQTLTTDVGDSGSRALGDTHSAIRLDVLKNSAEWVAEVLNYQLIPAILRANFGDDSLCPFFTPGIEEPKDAKGMAERDKILVGELKLPVGKAWFYERHGIPVPAEGEELLKEPGEEMPEDGLPGENGGLDPSKDPNGPPEGKDGPSAKELENETPEEKEKREAQAARARAIVFQARKNALTDRLTNAVLEDLTGVSVQWLGPVKPMFRELLLKAQDDTVTDEELISALEGSIARMPELFEHLDSGKLATALESALGAAVLNGAVQGVKDRGE